MQRSLGLQRTGASSSAAAGRPRNNSVALTCPFTTRGVHAAAGSSTARRSRDVAPLATSVEKSAPSGVTTPASGTATTKRATPSAPVFLAGADGFMGVRVLRELLLAGAKVTAGVQDAEQAAAVREFMGRYELVTKASLANLTLVEQGDLDDKQTLSKLPKRAKFVYIDGDQSASGRPQDPRALAAVLDAASSSGASQIVVLSLSGGGGGGGGGGFGIFGKAGGSSPGARRTRVEEQVADSGVPFIALRATVGSDSPDEELGALTRGVRLGAAGTLGGVQRTSRQQVASVVSELLRQPETNGLLLELASDADASPAGLDAVVSRAVSEARASQPEEEAAPVAAKGAAAKEGTMSLRQKAVAAVAPKGRQASKEDEEEEEEDEEKKPFGLFSSLAPKRRAQVKEEEEEEEEEEEGAKAAPLGLLGGLFGGKAAQDSNSVKVKAGSSPSVKVKAGSSPSSGAAERAAAAKDAAAARAAERERAVAERAEAAKAAREEAAERAAAAREAAAERAAAAKAAREEAAERAAAAREAAAEKAAAARAAAAKRPAVRGRGREEEEEEEEPKKGGGLFGFLFGGGAKDDDEEEEAPRSGTGKVRGSAKVAVGAPKPGSAKVAAQRPGSAKVAAAPKPGSAKVAVQRPGSSKVKAAPAPTPPQSRGAVGFPTARGAVSKKK